MNTAVQTPVQMTLTGVGKVYANDTTALQNVNLEIRRGEFYSFVGPSGCGKSTIFKLIAGLSEPTSGSIEMNGEELSKEDIGFVFQNATLLPWRPVLDNVALPLELKGVGKKERREKAQEAVDLVGLSGYEESLPRELSGGMQMRVSIARALTARPKLLLMDEPFGALDEMTRQNLHFELLRIWQKTEMTVLFITHNVFESVFLSTKVAIMSAGPGRITKVHRIPDYERNERFRSSPEFSDWVGTISEELHQHEA
ncbi:ABC transporter ATP-binding protein [Alkalicoccus urumqiensis]|uniref:Nitrate/sulfonate/bicarbonate ABC transporter ATP-binding protein n=1 Tax=Alkalicoccus urumqiensis TaxID=1548213 RepID=A0A2P6MJH8_ALKUR|nr:ABC transporter ATP-binding protein [Alkalicoccus urumqiensis]PRO66431.1 nitrate/sulfonate/bicarbonate ABC transporter ATP-binding protein [Alkalicoccus urumqiensis]